MSADPSSTSTHVTYANDLNFADEVLRSELPVLVDVSAEWCAPCRAAAPIVAELAQRFRGRLKVVELDGGNSPLTSAQLQVRGFPTFLGFSRGKLIERSVGFGGRKPLEALANSLLAADPD